MKDYCKMTLKVIYENHEEEVTGEATEIQQRFKGMVQALLNGYYDKIEIQLLDNANRIYKSFKEHI